MTNLEWLKSYYPKISEEQFDEIITKEIEKADKYRWHDLRKNPDDLPNNDERVIVSGKKGGIDIARFSNTGIGNLFWLRGGKLFKAIAWREIEEFEGSEE